MREKRAMIDPDATFLEQLDVWEMCEFDLQSRLILDKEPNSERDLILIKGWQTQKACLIVQWRLIPRLDD